MLAGLRGSDYAEKQSPGSGAVRYAIAVDSIIAQAWRTAGITLPDADFYP